MIKKVTSFVSILAFVFSTLAYNPFTASAAQFTGVKDTMSTVATSATATHTLNWTLVGGDTVATGETFIIDYVNADFTLNSAATWVAADFAYSDGTRTNQAPVAVGAAPSCSAGANNYTVTVDSTNNTFTITTCASWTTSGSNPTITFVINGTAATGAGTMTNKSTDTDASNGSKYTITESNGDAATGAVTAETNGVVTVTASVDPTLTFSNTQSAVDFGTLSSTSARFATAGAASGGNASVQTAHTLTVGTNAPSGYTVTYNSPQTLTNGANSITAVTLTGSASGTAGNPQFALNATVNAGSPTIPSAYAGASNNWKFAASSTEQVFSGSGAVSGDAVNVRYLANIPASQAPGSYSTTLTWVATANF